MTLEQMAGELSDIRCCHAYDAGSDGQAVMALSSNHIAFTISSVTFLASPNSIMVLSLKKSWFSTPA